MNEISLMEIRELIYDMLIYNFDTYQVIYNLLTMLNENKISLYTAVKVKKGDILKINNSSIL